MRLLSALVLLAAVLGSSGVLAAAEVPPPSQVEADWLRQNELRTAPHAAGASIAPELDAAGACDGVKTGKWGFHTLAEANPWWQVDLGAVASLDRMLIYNRCDEFAPRNRAIIVLVSDDAATWRQVYQHDGTVFYGQSDGKPLSVALTGQQARYVRLQLPGTSYFHLDEVEVFAAGSPANIALGKPATQSSVSQWSERHTGTAAQVPAYQTAEAIERGQKLAEHLKLLGADVARQAEV
ncbi:MAG: discoidin domain-containing protein, partial [Dehalococcoidia bacterium]|nr:discoidin domain-containing protein [Dehalococcoidia bacterium]